MTPTTIAISLVAAHFIGDWVCQSRKMAMNKSSDILTLCEHVAIVTLVLAVPVVWFLPASKFMYLYLNAIFHGLIDWNIWSGYKAKVPLNHEYWKDKRFYDTIAIDQFLHIALILFFFL